MKGIDLSRRYYEEIFLPEYRKQVPFVEGHFAAGLVGEGSECFGFDDCWSRDHSFGPRLCIWLTQEDHARFGPTLETFWNSLPREFEGFGRATEGLNEGKRSGVFTVEEFYQRLLGVPGVPTELCHWLAIPEPSLAAATNGQVFIDGPGAFTVIRKTLRAHYPADVTRYLLAQNTAVAAQTGQYNLLRAYRHGEELAAATIRARFTQSAIAIVFLLNKTYRPFYKWAPRAMRGLPVMGDLIYHKLVQLISVREIYLQMELVEDICTYLLDEMRRQGYTSIRSDYMMDHIPDIIGGIESPKIRDRRISLVF